MITVDLFVLSAPPTHTHMCEHNMHTYRSLNLSILLHNSNSFIEI